MAKLITAANYLDINNLLFYTAKAIVGNMNGMTIEQKRAYTTLGDENGPTLEMEKRSILSRMGRRKRRRKWKKT